MGQDVVERSARKFWRLRRCEDGNWGERTSFLCVARGLVIGRDFAEVY